jgi:hypothetical protein
MLNSVRFHFLLHEKPLHAILEGIRACSLARQASSSSPQLWAVCGVPIQQLVHGRPVGAMSKAGDILNMMGVIPLLSTLLRWLVC